MFLFPFTKILNLAPYMTHLALKFLYIFDYSGPECGVCFFLLHAGNALERVQRVQAPADLWDITFCTR
jgi:hypothetical protein